ncbi:MAG: hypothetical protein KA817_02050 [Flavobacteriales bacterium]|nr:hypothetical protein [Flavobacteriales bacterium]
MSERIDHSNYEAWLLDRLEGNLDPEQDRMLTAFLALHPELDPGIEELPELTSSRTKLDANLRDSLKRSLPPLGLPGGAHLEDFLIAAQEGDLSAEQQHALESFLSAHPEHAREARSIALARITPEAIPFAERSQLVRSFPPVAAVSAWTLDDQLVARLEGDLDASKEEALTNYLAHHPEAQRQWELMQHTRVSCTEDAYPERDTLKQGGRVVPLFPRWVVRIAAAASVAMVLGVASWTLWDPSSTAPVNVAVVPSPVPAPPVTVPEQHTHQPISSVPMTGTVDRAVPQQVVTPEPRSTRPVSPTTPVEQPSPLPIELPQPPAPDLALEPGPDEVNPVSLVQDTPEPNLALAAIPEPTPVNTANMPATHTSVVGALTRTLRSRVLRRSSPDDRPLDSDDALAAADVGLRAVSSDRASIAVERNDNGVVRSFDLRLGPGLSIRSGR